MARLRKRWVRRWRCWQYRRLRSLAGARQLPPLIFIAAEIAPAAKTETQPTQQIPCGSCRALARLRKRCIRQRRCWQWRRLRSLAGARQLPHLSFVAAEIKLAAKTQIQLTQQIPCGSCRALARLRKRWVRRWRCWQYRRLRSLAGARQLPHVIFVAAEIKPAAKTEIRPTKQIPHLSYFDWRSASNQALACCSRCSCNCGSICS